MSMPVTRFKSPASAPQPADAPPVEVTPAPTDPSAIAAPVAALAIPDYAALGFAFVPAPGEVVAAPGPVAAPAARHAAPTMFAPVEATPGWAPAPAPTPTPAPVARAPMPTPAPAAQAPRSAASVEDRRAPALRSSTASADARATAMARASAMAAARVAAAATPASAAAAPPPSRPPAPVVAHAPIVAPPPPLDLFADVDTVTADAPTAVTPVEDPLADDIATVVGAPVIDAEAEAHADAEAEFDADAQDTGVWTTRT